MLLIRIIQILRSMFPRSEQMFLGSNKQFKMSIPQARADNTAENNALNQSVVSGDVQVSVTLENDFLIDPKYGYQLLDAATPVANDYSGPSAGIGPGLFYGQIITLQGTDDTNTITLIGTQVDQNYVLKQYDVIRLFWDGSLWLECPSIKRVLNKARRTILLTAAGGWPSTTNGCTINTKNEYTTNKQNLYRLGFDKDTVQCAEWTVPMPYNWDGGTVNAEFLWTTDGGTGDVIWGVQGRYYGTSGAGSAIDATWGTAQTATQTKSTDGYLQIIGTSPITIAGISGPGAIGIVQFRAYRNASAGGDTLSDTAYLIGIKVDFEISQYSDI
jgi:hypothetical protein